MRAVVVVTIVLTYLVVENSCRAEDLPLKGAPLEKSDIETAQAVPLAVQDPSGGISIVKVRLHWVPGEEASSLEDATSITLDGTPPDFPSAGIFTAQLWNASLASAIAWQEPWIFAHWKINDTPATDGTGVEAGLAVGMITTSARRKFPDNTIVIASINPDGSLGAVPKLQARIQAAAMAGYKTVVIANLQRFDTGPAGEVINIVREANAIGVNCIVADTVVEATQKIMGDPLPAVNIPERVPVYSQEVSGYLDDNAKRMQDAVSNQLRFAPPETDLDHFPPFLAAKWREIRNLYQTGQAAYRAGQLYPAYCDFALADAEFAGANTAALSNKEDFDVKNAISASDDLRKSISDLLVHPPEDQPFLKNGLLVAELADWVYSVQSPVEGAEMLVKQTFSQRTDATPEEQTAARVRLVFAIETAKHQMQEAPFFVGLLAQIKGDTIAVETNGNSYYSQLLPVELAAAQLFAQRMRSQVPDIGTGLLFDYRLASYAQSVRKTKAVWEARLRQREIANAEKTAQQNADDVITQPVSATSSVAFDPGNTFAPPKSTVYSSAPEQLTQTAQCLSWVNDDCEINVLNQKYLELKGWMDRNTFEWHVQDRPKLDQMLTLAEADARFGISMAAKSGIDTSLLSMIYERARALRTRPDDSSGLEALRNFWRCSLLGNLAYQLSYTPKAKPVIMPGVSPANNPAPHPVAATPKPTPKPLPPQPIAAHTPVPPAPVPTLDINSIPVAPIAPVATQATITQAPAISAPPTQAPAGVPTNPNEQNIPVAPVAVPDAGANPPAVPQTTPVPPAPVPAQPAQ